MTTDRYRWTNSVVRSADVRVCRCGKDCEFPCWQRLGIAPPCKPCGCSEGKR